MERASNELKNMLTDFMLQEIGQKALDGITYAFVLKSDKDKENYRNYMDIRREATKCGYNMSEIFRVYEVSNGYIFDMEIAVAKQISYLIAKAVNKTNGGKTPVKDFIKDYPERRRKSDMVGLARYVKSCYDKRETTIEVALFSRNSTPKITITGVGQNKEMLAIKYNAFAIRHWDIESVNKNLLIPAKIRIARMEPCEILPSKTGVKFKLYIESIYDY